MRHILIATALVLASATAFAEPQCTTAERSTWQNADQFQAQLKEQGYRINKFKITKGNCYEIYGFDKDGRKVEIYHDPVSGKAVKSEIHD
ncbi:MULTISPECIES: PepSY domain-containing protein [Pseudomonas]|uniref:Dihydroxybiphenyl dioxygenase n=1 Tax=Pseudomonas putida TaxID=303 RepID=A0A1B2F7L7_PSEPU|nr:MULTISPECIES: PepSY domain-containing protein [Pseudomonas]ANY88227.1 Dihydroxybiphenyl dioxygenase [Pseudomonas putida]MCL8304195.1 PepSY domain-containing protein [Pseudomonas putida]